MLLGVYMAGAILTSIVKDLASQLGEHNQSGQLYMILSHTVSLSCERAELLSPSIA